MLLAQKMWNAPVSYCESWNFGPKLESVANVWDIATSVVKYYGKGTFVDASDHNSLHEAKLLMLDISKAYFKLGWQPRLKMEQSVQLTVDWYKRYKNESVYDLCIEQITKYINV